MPAQELDVTEYVAKTFTYSLKKGATVNSSITLECHGYIHTNNIHTNNIQNTNIAGCIKQLTFINSIAGDSMYKEISEDSLYSVFNDAQFSDIICIVKLSAANNGLNGLSIIFDYNIDSLYDFDSNLTYKGDTNNNNKSLIDISGSEYYVGIKAADPDLGIAKAIVGYAT